MYKKSSWSSVLVVTFLLLAIGLLVACQPEPLEIVKTVVVTETIVEEGETVEVTRIVYVSAGDNDVDGDGLVQFLSVDVLGGLQGRGVNGGVKP